MRSSPGSEPCAVAVAARLDGSDTGRSAARVACDRLLIELAQSRIGRDDWSVRHQPNAAPTLFRKTQRSALVASLAHSGSWIAAGLAEGADIGVDIQLHQDASRAELLAEFLELSHGDTGFFDAWVLRESIAKATGGSVLSKHPAEADLAIACQRPGQVVAAGDFEALVETVDPEVSFAVVIRHHRAIQHCA